VAGNWEYISGVFAAASELAARGQSVTAASTLVSIEESGTVTFSSANLEYRPPSRVPLGGGPGGGPMAFVGATLATTDFVVRLLSTETADGQPFAPQPPNVQMQIGYYIEQPLGADDVIVVLEFGKLRRRGVGRFTPLSNVETAANVMYGEGPGVASEVALYAISLGTPETT
jgi:hypothetical protein